MDKKINLANVTMVAGVTLFFLALLIFISYFVLPLSDESFPFAISLRFIHGQRPFVDDLSPFMGVGLLLLPLVKASLLLHHGKDELILFSRHVFIVVGLLFGLQVFFSAKKYLPLLPAFFIAVLVAAYHPFGINNFHYDTLVELFWSAILFQLYNFLFHKENSLYHYLLFSLFNLGLCLIYPTFVALLLPLYVACHFFLRNKKSFWFSHFFVFGIASVFMGWLIFNFFKVQLSDIAAAIHFNQHGLLRAYTKGDSIADKFIKLVYRLMSSYSGYILFSVIFVGVAFWLRKVKWLVPILIAVPLIKPLWGMDLQHAVYREAFYFLNCIGFLGIVTFLFFYRKDNLGKRLFYAISLPSLFAGLLIGVTSTNLDLNFNIGFFPASLLGFIYVYKVIKEFGHVDWAAKAVFLYGFIMVAFFQTNYIYGSNFLGFEIYKNTVLYDVKGPFNGLYVDPYWFKVMSQLQKDIKNIDTDSNKFVYFGPVSAGYLLVDNLKPGEYSLFSEYAAKHFGANLRFPNFSFDLTPALYGSEHHFQDYIAGASYKKILTAEHYAIYYAG